MFFVKSFREDDFGPISEGLAALRELASSDGLESFFGPFPSRDEAVAWATARGGEQTSTDGLYEVLGQPGCPFWYFHILPNLPADVRGRINPPDHPGMIPKTWEKWDY